MFLLCYTGSILRSIQVSGKAYTFLTKRLFLVLQSAVDAFKYKSNDPNQVLLANSFGFGIVRRSINRSLATNDHVVQKSAMLEGKLIIIPALGHQNKGKSSFTGSGLFVSMSHCGNNIELALQHGGFCTT